MSGVVLYIMRPMAPGMFKREDTPGSGMCENLKVPRCKIQT